MTSPLARRITVLEAAQPAKPTRPAIVRTPEAVYNKLIRDIEEICRHFETARLVLADGRVHVGEAQYFSASERQALEERADFLNRVLEQNPGGLYVLTVSDLDELLDYAAQGFSLLPGERTMARVITIGRSETSYSPGVKRFTAQRLDMTLDIQVQLGQEIPHINDEFVDWLQGLRASWQKIEDELKSGEFGYGIYKQ